MMRLILYFFHSIVQDIYAKLRRDFVPTYIVDDSMWPIVQGLNFYFVPVRHQLLCVNTVCYFDDVFLSYVQHNGIPKIFEIIEDAWADYLDDPDVRITHTHNRPPWKKAILC